MHSGIRPSAQTHKVHLGFGFLNRPSVFRWSGSSTSRMLQPHACIFSITALHACSHRGQRRPVPPRASAARALPHSRHRHRHSLHDRHRGRHSCLLRKCARPSHATNSIPGTVRPIHCAPHACMLAPLEHQPGVDGLADIHMLRNLNAVRVRITWLLLLLESNTGFTSGLVQHEGG